MIDQGCKQNAKQVFLIICDVRFWKDSDTIHQILAPIHKV